jgi:predicted ATPase/class 3 adenylate cyclase
MRDQPSGTVTFLFTDIEGSTRLWERHPAAMASALARHDALLRASVAGHGGCVFKTVGDAFCAAFHTVSAGLAAATDAQRALRDEPWPADVRIRVRMGLHTGAAELRDDDYFGPPLNRVARLMSAGHGGQVLLSQAAQELLRDGLPAGVVLRDMGERRLKDLIRPEHVYQLVAPGLDDHFPPLNTLDARAHNLPVQSTSFVGREREIREVERALASGRLVTLTGTGGAGKSRLALQVAAELVDEYADGAWLVELASLGDPAQVPSAVCAGLGIVVAPGATPATELSARLRSQSMLLVLDNCEHLIDAVAELLEGLLATAPNLHVLASSQEPLGIAGEHVFRLPSLAVPADAAPTADAAMTCGAVQLFVERARTAQPSFVLDDRSAPTVATICRRLDGIPLALEMAAARVPLLGVEALEQRLDERFRVLTAGKRTALPRQRTLQATLDWSYGLLDADEQAVLRRLGVFAGQFSLDAAVAVAADEKRDEFAIIECLAGLCDHSLVWVNPTDGAARYALLETTRAYALERLAAAGETAATARRHALHYRQAFACCFDDWTRLSDTEFRARYFRDIDNLRVAVAWAFGADGDDETAIALAGSSVQVWVGLGLFAEAETLLQQACERIAPTTPPALDADLSFAVAIFYGQRHQLRTIAAARRAVELWRGLGERTRLGCALYALGGAYAAEGEAEAEPILREAQPIFEESGRARLQAMAHAAFALLHAARGRPLEATRESRAALELYQAAGAEGAVLSTLGALADQVWAQGELDRAVEAAREVIELHRRSPFSGRIARIYTTANLFGMLVERGDLDEARSIGRELLPQMAELGIVHGWSDHFASCLARSGRGADAVRLVGWADALRAARGLNRQPNEQRARQATLAIARERDAGIDVDRLLAEGAVLAEAQAHRIAQHTTDSLR